MAPQGDTTNAKQLIVGRVQQATNILVAVSTNPSIDSLSAALALTLVLNKLDKHGTAVFSGQVPAVMQFLNPEKTFENNVDSLRDFIISLDKEKADRLRYKLEKDVVRIFITPFRTTISEKDLQFSQGDFNVDLVIALGVEKREDLDKAIVAHGRILHDATVVTINSGGHQSSLGAVDWNDPNSSSLCEMLISLIEAMQKPGLLDAQTANALLTGIVAATDRFSNQHTTPRVMTMAAQLMAAGANQQLIAINVQKPEQMAAMPAPVETEDATVNDKGELSIKHSDNELKDEPGKRPEPLDTKDAEAELEAALPTPEVPDIDKSLNDLKAQLEEVVAPEPELDAIPEPPSIPEVKTTEHKFVSEALSSETELAAADASDKPQIKDEKSSNAWRGHRLEPPTLGGSLSSTSEEALEDKQRVEEDTRNHKLLSHGGEPEGSGEDDARQAVNGVFGSQDYNVAGNPRQDLGTQPLSPPPDVQPYIPIEPNPAIHPVAPLKPNELPKDANGLPIIPPMPSLPIEDPTQPGLPPMPPPLPPLPGEQVPPTPPTDNPGQFKIPGQ